jgi:hypothetical protein
MTGSARASADTIYTSGALRARFLDRTRALVPNDSVVRVSGPRPTKRPLLDGFYCIGSLPGAPDPTSRNLFSIPRNAPPELIETLVRFTPPIPGLPAFITCGSSTAFIEMTLSLAPDKQFYTLYLPNIASAPYFFCCRFPVNPFTFPSFCSSFSLPDMFNCVADFRIPISQVCFVLQSSFPFRSLFYGLCDWILESEKIARFQIAPLLDLFVQDGSARLESDWPHRQAAAMVKTLGRVQRTEFDSNSPDFALNEPPWPAFSWIHAPDAWEETSMACDCLSTLLRFVNLKAYLSLLAALFTESPLVVFGREVSDVADIVLLLNLLLHPLKWVNSTISILPPSHFALFDAPVAVLVGVTEGELPPLAEAFVVVDLVDGIVKGSQPIPELPGKADFEARLRVHWEGIEGGRRDAVAGILEATQKLLGEMLAHIACSIITDFSAHTDHSSTFAPELFLASFQVEDRPFMQLMCETQMMQFFIEQECRRISETFDRPES